MAELRAELVIGAKDNTGGAFAALKAHISALDKQISTFDKLMSKVGSVAKANDPLIASITRSEAALKAERDTLATLGEGMASAASSSEAFAGSQAALATEIGRSTEMMVVQGREAARLSEQITRATQRTKAAKEGAGVGGAALGAAGGLVEMAVGGGMLKSTEDILKAAAKLEQIKLHVREVSASDASESPFAEGLAQEIATKYPSISQAEALSTYVELRPNAADEKGIVDKDRARHNLEVMSKMKAASTALGFEFTPEDAQNLLKATESSGHALDPKALDKITDAYFRAKQVFGTAIATKAIRDYVMNAKTANFTVGDDQFFRENLVRLAEGNAPRLGNETAQTLATLAGGHMTTATGRWLVEHGLAREDQLQKMGGGNVRIVGGLKGGDLLQVDQEKWANQFLLPSLKGALTPEKIAAREAMLRKPGDDEHALYERAVQGLVAGEISTIGVRTTVADNLSHWIANDLIIQRDVEEINKASAVDAGAAAIGQNPISAWSEFTTSIENFASVAGGPAMKPSAAALDALAHGIANLGGVLDRVAKAHPELASTAAVTGLGGAAAGGGALLWRAFGGGFGLRGSAVALDKSALELSAAAAALKGAGAGAAAAEAAPAAARSGVLGLIARAFGAAAGAGYLLYNAPTTDQGIADNANGFNAWFNGTTVGKWLNSVTGRQDSEWAVSPAPIDPFSLRSPAGAMFPVKAPPLDPGVLEQARRSEVEWRQDPEAARGRAMLAHHVGVNVSGEAKIDQARLDLTLGVDGEFRAMLGECRTIGLIDSRCSDRPTPAEWIQMPRRSARAELGIGRHSHDRGARR